jgi:hypothetical protein
MVCILDSQMNCRSLQYLSACLKITLKISSTLRFESRISTRSTFRRSLLLLWQLWEIELVLRSPTTSQADVTFVSFNRCELTLAEIRYNHHAKRMIYMIKTRCSDGYMNIKPMIAEPTANRLLEARPAAPLPDPFSPVGFSVENLFNGKKRLSAVALAG